MGNQSRNQRHTPQRRNPRLPPPPHLVARSALKPPQLLPQALWHCGKGMNAFVNHFSPRRGGNAQSHNSAIAKLAAAATAKPHANTGAKKPRACGLCKR